MTDKNILFWVTFKQLFFLILIIITMLLHK